MIFAYFILAVALLIEVVGAYYSITGLAAIFSGAVVPILIMGGSLEVGKVTAAVWLKQNWTRASMAYKLYMSAAVIVLMLITSMGIFGFLSKAHNDQNLVSGDVQSRIAIYDEKIKTAKDNIEANRKALKQMDEAVDQVMARSSDEKGADKSNAIRKSQAKDRSALAKDIEANQKLIATLNDEAAPIRAEVRKVEAEVGPIKYIAALIYGDNPDTNILERAVTWVILIIVAVFDPLALVLILAAQQTLRWAQDEEDEDETDAPGPNPAVEQVVEPEPLPQSVTNNEIAPQPQELITEPEIDLDHINSLLEEAKEIEEPQVSYQILEDVDDELDIPVLENEEMWAQRVIDEQSIPGDASSAKRFGLVEPEVKVEEPEPEYVSPNAPGLDASIERPGDYLTHNDKKQLEAAPGKNRGVMYSAIADNSTNVHGNASHADFGDTFPVTPNKGDTYLRIDSLPNKLYKFNGNKWIEIDKDSTDTYAYNEAYIQHLVTQLEQGQYDPDLLTDVEREQIQHFLSSK